FFAGRLKSSINLPAMQRAILLAIGLQHKEVETSADELNMPVSQFLAIFMKILRKIMGHLGSLVSGAMAAEMPDPRAIGVSTENASGAHDDEIIDNKYVPLAANLDD